MSSSYETFSSDDDGDGAFRPRRRGQGRGGDQGPFGLGFLGGGGGGGGSSDDEEEGADSGSDGGGRRLQGRGRGLFAAAARPAGGMFGRLDGSDDGDDEEEEDGVEMGLDAATRR